MNVACVVFDIDDTLYLERTYVRSGFEAVAEVVGRQHGLQDFAERAWQLFEAGVRHDTFNRVFADAGMVVHAEAVAHLVACYRAHEPRICLLDDARACLDTLRPGPMLAAITDGPVASQRAKSTALRLDRWLSPIVFTGELGPGRAKPSVVPFELVEKTAKQNRSACVYVADNPAKDFIGPHLLGWKTIRVRRPAGLHASAPSGRDIDCEIESLADLVRVIELS